MQLPLPDSAFRPAPAPQDWARLAAWLGGRLDLTVPPRQFAGGIANLNYLVRVNENWAVLRRPPAGPLPTGANDMAREWRVLSRLPAHFPLCPKGVAYCEDATVLGAPFLLSEFRAGVGIGAALPPEAPPGLANVLAATSATLHAIDPIAAQLEALGKPDGFLARQVAGWRKRAQAAFPEGMPPALADSLAWLEVNRPPEAAQPRVLHGDLKLDNLLFSPATWQPVALVDWDIATLGDPLLDVAVTLSYWIEPDDPPVLQDLRQLPAGLGRKADYLSAYAHAAGIPRPDISWHLLLARVRLGVVWRNLYSQWQRGALAGERYAGFHTLSRAVLDHAWDTRLLRI
jgi:aminoglycoside phosphotransferase (APT) family kinase protein